MKMYKEKYIVISSYLSTAMNNLYL